MIRINRCTIGKLEFVPLTHTMNNFFDQQVFSKAVNCFKLFFVLQNANSSYGLFRGLRTFIKWRPPVVIVGLWPSKDLLLAIYFLLNQWASGNICLPIFIWHCITFTPYVSAGILSNVELISRNKAWEF